MQEFGKELKKGELKRTEDNVSLFNEAEKEIQEECEKVKLVGLPEEKINARGQMTVWQRLEYLVDPGTWSPLHTLFNPEDNEEGTTNVIDGIGRISGRWAVIIGFDNKLMAGAWIPGQADNVLRTTDLAKRQERWKTLKKLTTRGPVASLEVELKAWDRSGERETKELH